MMVKCRKKRPAPVAAEQVWGSKAGHRVINPKDDPRVLYIDVDSSRILRNARKRLSK